MVSPSEAYAYSSRHMVLISDLYLAFKIIDTKKHFHQNMIYLSFPDLLFVLIVIFQVNLNVQ